MDARLRPPRSPSVPFSLGIALFLVGAGTVPSPATVRAGGPHHTLRITGDAAPKGTFLNRLAMCTKENLSFAADGETVADNGNLPGAFYASLRTLKDNIMASGNTVVIHAIAGPSNVIIIDAWNNPAGGSIDGRVDMHDIQTLPFDQEIDRNADGTADGLAVVGTWIDTNSDGFPDDPVAAPAVPQHAKTRCDVLAHILGERYYGVQNAGAALAAGQTLYGVSHDIPAAGQGGIGTENAVMLERWTSDVANNATTISLAANPIVAAAHGGHTDVRISKSNGSTERWHLTGANGEFTISY